MEIGLHAFNPYSDFPGYLDHCRDLGFTWTKIGTAINTDELEDLRPQLEIARELGMRCIIDLRTEMGWLSERAIKAQVELNEQGKLIGKQPGDSHERIQEIIIENQKMASSLANSELSDKARAFVERHKDFCQDYEFWGEYRCPWVSRGMFDRQQCYPAILEWIHRAVHDVLPDARVWNGGYGMDLDCNFLLALVQEEAQDAFEVANWHPYFMHIRNRAHATDLAESGYAKVREALMEAGTNQPFASTEWGYPTLRPDTPQAVVEYLKSNVVHEGVRQLTAEEGAEWYETDLEIMERHGFEVVIVHELYDLAPEKNTSKHWGGFCGLLTHDGLKKPTYEIIQTWAEKGREGKPAFADMVPWGTRKKENDNVTQ